MNNKSNFIRGLIAYCLILSMLVYGALLILYKFLVAYEDSRPENAVNSFISSLTVDHIIHQSEDILASVNTDIQSREEAEQVIRTALSDKIKPVKDASYQDGLHYNLFVGSQKIGSFELTCKTIDSFGFNHYAATNPSYDLSYLSGKEATITVPEEAKVTFLGKELSDKNVIRTNIPFNMFKELSQDALPQQCTYKVSGYLGQPEWQVITEDGTDVTGQDYESIFSGTECSEQERVGLEDRIYKFLDQYIAYCGSNKSSASWRLYAMKESLVDGPLFDRLYSAMDGLTYGQSRGDKRVGTELHCLKKIDESLYYADVTYLVDTTGQKGVVQTTNNLKILLVPSGKTYLVSDISSY